MFTAGRLRSNVAALTAAGFLVASCVQVPTRDPGDTCATYRAPFERMAQEWNQRIVQWATSGALAGALATLRKRNPSIELVLRNMLIGAVAGATIGYMLNVSKRARTQDQMIEEIARDSRAAFGQIAQLKRALSELGQCRARQLDSLQEDVRAGRLPRAAIQARLDSIKKWIADDQSLVHQTVGLTDKHTRIYLGSYAAVTRQPVDQLIDEWQRYQPTAAAPAVSGDRLFTTTALRLRAGPGTGHRVLLTVPRGAAVRVLGRTDGWAEVEYRGQRGYAAARYLSPQRPGPAAPVVAERSEQETDPIRKVAFAQRELEAESRIHKQEIDRRVAELEVLLRTQARRLRNVLLAALEMR